MSKLGRTAKERTALVRGLASQLLWFGKVETTLAKAKEVQSYTEKLLTKAINTYADVEDVTLTKKDAKGKEVEVKATKDGVKKLAARRAIMAKVYDLQEIKAFNESKTAYKARTADSKHPLVDKIFNEYAPKYAARKEELGQGGGYTRVIKLGERRGDAAETAIIELV